MSILQTVKSEWQGKNRGGWIIVLGVPLFGGIASFFGDGWATGLVIAIVVVVGLIDRGTYPEGYKDDVR